MDVVHCPHCGKELPPEMQFCPYCMERIDEPAAVSADELRPTRQWKNPNKTTVLLTSIALCAVLAASLGVGMFRHAQAKSNLPAVTPENSAYTETAPTDENGEPITDAPTEKSKIGSLFGSIFSADKQTDANTPTGGNTAHENAAQSTAGGNSGSPNSAGTNTGTSVGNTPTASPVAQPPQSGSASGGSENTDPCANGHTWVPVTETVHHDEVGHYEPVEHQRTVTKYKCPVCYETFASLEVYYAHFDSVHTPSYSGDPIRALRNQYTTANEIEAYTTNEWVVDTAAYDETVIVGYTCSVCGAKQ